MPILAGITKYFTKTYPNTVPMTLTASIIAGATTVPVTGLTNYTDGDIVCLTIDPSTPTLKQVFTGTKSGSNIINVVWTDSYAGSNSPHTLGAVIVDYVSSTDWDMLTTGIQNSLNQDGTMKPTAVQTALGLGSGALNGWNALGVSPNTITDNGNGSYNMVWNASDQTGTLSPGMRLRSTRTISAPTQCTNLNGTTQYYSKTSPAGMTFTNNFVVSAWVKLTSYAVSNIVSRFNGTNGWTLQLLGTGQIQLVGFNSGAGNQSYVTSNQSLPLNKWVHVAAQLDMATFTATTTTSYIMLNGIDIFATVNRTGTNPTALIQAGNLEIGSQNGGTSPFPGKIAQVAIYSAKVTEATIAASRNQTLAGTETSLISAYSLSGANGANDLNVTSANNLTANGSPTTTTVDAPWTQQSSGTPNGSLDYAILQSVTFSTNTTAVLQLPEGCTLPTTGGVSAVVYSSNKAPYGFPSQLGKWTLSCITLTQLSQSIVSGTNFYKTNGMSLTMPVGEWVIGGDFEINGLSSVSTIWDLRSIIVADTAATVANGAGELNAPDLATRHSYNWSGTYIETTMSVRGSRTVSAQTVYSHYIFLSATGTLTGGLRGVVGSQMYAENAYL